MTPSQLEFIKRETSKLVSAGYGADDIAKHVLAQPQFNSLMPSERGQLGLKIIEFFESISTQVTPQPPMDPNGPAFPVSQTIKGKGGRLTEMVVANHPDNMKFLVSDVMGLRPQFNTLKNRIYLNGQSFNDFDLGNIRNRCREYGLSSEKDFVIEVISELAKGDQYHPFIDAIRNVQYDGQDHIGALFETLKISESAEQHKPLYAQYLRRWLIATVTRACNPGVQNLVLTFISPQGAGKSRWLQRLASIAPEIYGEGSINPDNKDHELRHLNYILWHIPEIDGLTRKADVAALKDYLTKSDVAVRESYGRFDRVGKSVLSFCASVNSSNFLVDETGNRRFLVMNLDGIDANHSVDIMQVWAQAYHAYLANEKYYFDSEEIININSANEDFQQENYINLMASEIEPGTDELTGIEIFALLYGKSTPHSGELSKLGALLKRKKIKAERRTKNGIKNTYYLIKKPERTIF
jgi:hypothetical protein